MLRLLRSIAVVVCCRLLQSVAVRQPEEGGREEWEGSAEAPPDALFKGVD